MEEKNLFEVLVHTKRIGGITSELLDISQQIAEALDRNDQVSVRMLISMREEPIGKLKLADSALRNFLAGMEPQKDRERLSDLLNGKVEAPRAGEETLAKQASSNLRQFAKLKALDEILNKKIARDKSIYTQK